MKIYLFFMLVFLTSCAISPLIIKDSEALVEDEIEQISKAHKG